MEPDNNRDERKIDWDRILGQILIQLKNFGKNFVHFLAKGGWLVFLGFFLDLATKLLMERVFPDSNLSLISDSEGRNILGITLVYNQGMGYGFLEGQRVFLAILSGVVGIGLIVFLAYRFDRKTPVLRYALYLLIAGDFGNFIDRAFYNQGVIDWIWIGNSSWLGAFHFVCNIADILLTAGVIVLVISIILMAVRESKQAKEIDPVSPENQVVASDTTEDVGETNTDPELSDIDSLKKGLGEYSLKTSPDSSITTSESNDQSRNNNSGTSSDGETKDNS